MINNSSSYSEYILSEEKALEMLSEENLLSHAELFSQDIWCWFPIGLINELKVKDENQRYNFWKTIENIGTPAELDIMLYIHQVTLVKKPNNEL